MIKIALGELEEINNTLSNWNSIFVYDAEILDNVWRRVDLNIYQAAHDSFYNQETAGGRIISLKNIIKVGYEN